jgi:hypothetical protein
MTWLPKALVSFFSFLPLYFFLFLILWDKVSVGRPGWPQNLRSTYLSILSARITSLNYRAPYCLLSHSCKVQGSCLSPPGLFGVVTIHLHRYSIYLFIHSFIFAVLGFEFRVYTYTLSHSASPFLVKDFLERGSHRTNCPGWLGITICLISVSWVARLQVWPPATGYFLFSDIGS